MEHSFYMPVSAIRGLFSQLLTVPLYRQPNTLGWPYLDAPIDPGDQWSSDTFLPLRNLLMLLPNFMPSAVQELLQTFQINGTHFYNLSPLTHLREKGILPGTRSDDMSSLYDWPFFLARCCLGQVPGGAPFSQRSEQATACTNRKDELEASKAKQITN